ncbi:hypothetical protein PJL15_00281 [Paenarthrobacter nitroguajacolicus]|nr:hypothetical protein [Paenarthrobacter nitroguajacolicus]
MPGQVFGHRVKHDVGTQAEGLLHQGRGESIVGDHDGARGMGGVGEGTDIGDSEHGVGGAFKPEQVRFPAVFRADQCLDGLRVGDVHGA